MLMVELVVHFPSGLRSDTAATLGSFPGSHTISGPVYLEISWVWQGTRAGVCYANSASNYRAVGPDSWALELCDGAGLIIKCVYGTVLI